MLGLLSWFVSSSSSIPELTCHGVERGLHVNPCGGEGVAKAWYGQLVSLENQFTDHVSVCFKFVMANSLNVSGRLANKRIPLTQVLGCEAVSGQGGDVALNTA